MSAGKSLMLCALLLLCAVGVSACGIRKKLYIPGENGKKITHPAQPSSSPMLGTSGVPYEPPERALLPLQEDRSMQANPDNMQLLQDNSAPSGITPPGQPQTPSTQPQGEGMEPTPQPGSPAGAGH
jgi:hypothetical protein